jgi:glycosyltransferase involved in cell wall biosynthesis
MYENITVVLPVMDAHNITDEAISNLLTLADKEPEVIIIDNASNEPATFVNLPLTSVLSEYFDIQVIRNERNVAGYGALLQALEIAQNDIVLWMHNDVLVHEQGWDTRILAAFNDDPLLAIAGFFGAPGVADNGGRIGSMGNMLGKKWGTPQHMHGAVMTDIYPAVVFDALAIIINRKHFNAADVPLNIPPHHWNDRILPLWFVDRGYHAATIGIGFDHKGGVSSLGDKYRELAERWSKEHNLPMEGDWDTTFYRYGERYFRRLMGNRSSVRVDEDYTIV